LPYIPLVAKAKMIPISKAVARRLRSLLCGDQEPGLELSALLRLRSLLHQEEETLNRKRDGVDDDDKA
jgi:hypothetical protein